MPLAAGARDAKICRAAGEFARCEVTMTQHDARLAELPPEAGRYFDAVAAADADAAAACFGTDAVVMDVGRPIAGPAAIRGWLADEVIGGRYRILEAAPRPGGTFVLLTFAPPGEEAFRARYTIEVAGGRIARMILEYA